MTKMLPELDEIARRRRALGLTQGELAKAAGVSRSLVAKLEKKLVNASYIKVKDIFDALEALEAERSNDAMVVAVGRIHNGKIEYASASETVYAVWERMDRNAYSQLPVKDAASIVGSITERAISSRGGARKAQEH